MPSKSKAGSGGQVIYYPGGKTKVISSRSAPRRYSISGPPSSAYTSSYVSRSTPLMTDRLAGLEPRLDSHVTADDYLVKPAMSYTQLRSKAVDARNKMDRHRTMLDRYLPVNLGPDNDVEYEVAYKYGELADRMPALEPYRPKTDAVSHSFVAPYNPPTKAARPLSEYAAKPPSGRMARPQVSDTRKRCREVLCKTKGDPRYYDY